MAGINPPPLKIPKAIRSDPEHFAFINQLLVTLRQLSVVAAPLPSLTPHRSVYTNGTGQLAALPPGAAGNTLVSGGEGVAPHWDQLAANMVAFTLDADGAVETTVEAKLQPLVNIIDFGAAADGIADDTAAVQAAALSGLSVAFADGQLCRTTAAITAWADGTAFVGSGSDNAGGIRLDTTTTNVDVITITSRIGVRLLGLSIDGGRSASHTNGYCVRMIGCTDCSAMDNRFSNSPSDTVLVRDGCVRVHVWRNTFAIQGNGTAHIYFLTNNSHCSAVDNYFVDSVGGCIWLSGNVLHTTIRGNRCAASEFELIGIRYDCGYGEVSGNVATGTGDNGISVTGYGFLVFGNDCHGNDHAGIGIYGTDNTVYGNACYDNGLGGGSQHPGILLAANFGGLAAHNTITGNDIYRKDGDSADQHYGIRLSNTSYTAWATAASITVGLFRTSANHLYVATTAGTTGASAPTHTTGTASDGAVTWRYLGTFTNTAARPAGNRIGPNKIRNHTGGDVVRFGSSVNQFGEEAEAVETFITPAWVTGIATLAGDVVHNVVSGVARRYRAITPGTTGATAPTHTASTASDGGVTWYYVGEGELHDVRTQTEKLALYRTPLKIQNLDSTSDTLAPGVFAGTLTPEGMVQAANGSIYLRSNSTYGISLYLKTGTTDTDTGWETVMMRLSGTTANRPAGLSGAQNGLMYFDTTLGKPVWWLTAGWVDATGAAA